MGRFECQTDVYGASRPLTPPLRDEGNEYRGIDRIRAWRADVEAKYTFTTTPREVVGRGDETVLIGSLAGDFPGSPVDLEHRFTLGGDRIMALTIQP